MRNKFLSIWICAMSGLLLLIMYLLFSKSFPIYLKICYYCLFLMILILIGYNVSIIMKIKFKKHK
jgi:hypothetical protein